MRLIIVGGRGITQIGESFARACHDIACEHVLFDTAAAFSGPRWLRALLWRYWDRRPCRLRGFNATLQHALREQQPDVLLMTGDAPVSEATLSRAAKQHTICVNYSTDDPWNPQSRSRRFLSTLPRLDWVFSPRQSNLSDFTAAGVRQVCYLPFGYDPQHVGSVNAPGRPASHVLFVGGADSDRIPWLASLQRARVPIQLAGQYWDRVTALRPFHLGYLSPDEVARQTVAAAVNLILVRRANRDGHTMRSFEAAACGGCLLVEDTSEHRAIYGPDGECVLYFQDTESMIARARELLADLPRCRRLGQAVKARITAGKNTYADRLKTILDHIHTRAAKP